MELPGISMDHPWCTVSIFYWTDKLINTDRQTNLLNHASCMSMSNNCMMFELYMCRSVYICSINVAKFRAMCFCPHASVTTVVCVFAFFSEAILCTHIIGMVRSTLKGWQGLKNILR